MKNNALYRKPNYLLRDYEWHYYIGGDCGLKHRKLPERIAYIYHREQGQYEATLIRNQDLHGNIIDTWSLGIFNDSNKAQAIINEILEEKFNEDTSAVCGMD
jgi:hypothetical protein